MTTSTSQTHGVRPLLSILFGFIGFLSLSLNVSAQDAGTVTGRVFNPYTGQNVRYAEITILETLATAVTDAEGRYRFGNAPAGKVTVTLLFTGYEFQTVEVNVPPGGTVTQDFNLRLPASEVAVEPGKDDDVIQLSAFVISGQREGNAKAIMEQRASQNISNVVSADAFGDVAEGNIGEFLKNMPGVDLDYVEADTRTPRLRGLPSQYTSVTMDGGQVASADAFAQFNSVGSGAGDSARSFGFEQVSINSIESIEVNKTASADFDAEGAAGTINMKTKRAFDRQGRRISFTANFTANSEEMNFKRSYGPDDRRSYKILPGGTFEYSDIFLDNRLGIIFNISESNSFVEQRRADHEFIRSATPGTAPITVRRINLKDGPKTTERSTITLTADYKISPKLDFGGSYIWSRYDAGIYNRTYQFQAGTSAAHINAVDPLTSISTTSASPNNARTLAVGGNAGVKLTHTNTLSGRARYRHENLDIEAKGSFSHSVNDYEGIVRGTVRDTITNALQNTQFTAVRSSIDDVDWKIVQTGGATDWSDLSGYTNPRIREEARFTDVAIYTAQVDATYDLNWTVPIKLKSGAKWMERHNRAENLSDLYQYNYVGPGGGSSGSFVNYLSRHVPEHGSLGAEVVALNGGTVRVADRNTLAELFKTNPNYFTLITPSATNLYNARVANQRNYRETVSAAYVMATATFNKLVLSAGLRFENTLNEARERNGYRADELTSLFGIPATQIDRAGRATTVDGIALQYLSRPDIIRESDYNNFFGSASAKYSLTKDLQLQLGANQGLQRPRFADVTGGITQDNDDGAVEFSLPNKNLKPELFNNYVGRAQYYFEPVGSLGVSAYQIDIKNSITKVNYNAVDFVTQFPDEALFDLTQATSDPDISTSTFRRKVNASGTSRFRGWEVEYSQQLSFLPGALRGFDVRASYTRNYARAQRQETLLSLSPHYVSGALGFRYRGFYINSSVKWTDDTPFESVRAELGNRPRVREARYLVDLSLSYRINSRYSISVQGRNIFNEALRVNDPATEIAPSVLWRIERYGALWTTGFRANF